MAVADESQHSAELTGAISSLIPHFIEPAILSIDGVTEEIGAPLISDFLREFQATQRALCNAVGFSNPLQKAVFNLSYGSRFSKEYRRLRPIITNFWQEASANELMPTESLAVVMCMKIKDETNIKIEDDDDL